MHSMENLTAFQRRRIKETKNCFCTGRILVMKIPFCFGMEKGVVGTWFSPSSASCNSIHLDLNLTLFLLIYFTSYHCLTLVHFGRKRALERLTRDHSTTTRFLPGTNVMSIFLLG